MANDTDETYDLTASNVIGIVQRGIRELDAYLHQPWYRIDKNRAMAYLGEAAQWVQRLEPLPQPDTQSPQPPPLPQNRKS